jgi:hypothetical protein
LVDVSAVVEQKAEKRSLPSLMEEKGQKAETGLMSGGRKGSRRTSGTLPEKEAEECKVAGLNRGS